MPKTNRRQDSNSIMGLGEAAEMYGRDELEKRRSVLEGNIRNYLKLLSVVEAIKSRLDSVDRLVSSGIEDSLINIKRSSELIEAYNSDKNTIKLNLFPLSDMAVTIGEAAAEDRAFLETLEGIEEESVNTDLATSADKIKSLYSIANLVTNN